MVHADEPEVMYDDGSTSHEGADSKALFSSGNCCLLYLIMHSRPWECTLVVLDLSFSGVNTPLQNLRGTWSPAQRKAEAYFWKSVHDILVMLVIVAEDAWTDDFRCAAGPLELPPPPACSMAPKLCMPPM